MPGARKLSDEQMELLSRVGMARLRSDTARRDFEEAIRAAYAGQVSLRAIMEYARMSHTRVHQIVEAGDEDDGEAAG